MVRCCTLFSLVCITRLCVSSSSFFLSFFLFFLMSASSFSLNLSLLLLFLPSSSVLSFLSLHVFLFLIYCFLFFLLCAASLYFSSFSCFFFQVLSFEWRHFLLTACSAATTSSTASKPPFCGHCLSCSLFGRHSDPCAAAVVRTPSGHRLFVIGSLYRRL